MDELRFNQINEFRNYNQSTELLFLFIFYYNFMALLTIYLMYIYYYGIDIKRNHLYFIFFVGCILSIEDYINISRNPQHLSY